MKKITLLISACIASVFTLFAQDQLMVHQNNGNITPFIASSVDSITIVSANNNEENKNEHQYVDMGLSVMWATCNIGANSPEEFGDYFAWGEKEAKLEHTPENWKGTSGPTWNLNDDPARNTWGGEWRVPTYWELKELIENCKAIHCVKTGKDGYGIIGTQFISKINGNKIFLPFAGHAETDIYYDYPETSYGATGWYRTSQYGISIALVPWGGLDYTDSSLGYYVGESIRPVYGEATLTGNFEDVYIEEENYQPIALSIDKSTIECYEGGRESITATSTSRVQWNLLSGNDVISIDGPYEPRGRTIYINALSEGTAVVQATDGRTQVVCIITVKGTPSSEYPIVEAPGAGKTTLVVYIPGSSCEEAIPYAIGYIPGDGNWENKEELRMTRCEGYDEWWQVTTEALNEENAPHFKFRMDDGNYGWSFEPKDTYVEIPEDYLQIVDDYYSYGYLKTISDCDNQVLYIKSGSWITPCNSNKAGKAIITANVPEVPEGYTVGLVGSFEEEYWDIYYGVRPMTAKGEGVYILETDVPAAFSFKILLSPNGIDWSWEMGQNNQNNFYMGSDLELTVTIDSWKGL